MTNQPPQPNDPTGPYGGGNNGLPSYDTTVAPVGAAEPGDGLIRDKKNYLEVSALLAGILSIISMFTYPPAGIILMLGGIVMSILALVQRKKYAPENRRTWFSVVGLVCSIISLIILVLFGVTIYALLESHPECQQGTSKDKAQCIMQVVNQS